MNNAPEPIKNLLALLYSNPKKVEHLVESLTKQEQEKKSKLVVVSESKNETVLNLTL
jgi:hypothetical protein